jgi:hypothetical protein
MKTILKHVLICIGGIVLTFVLLSLFVEVDLRIVNLSGGGADPISRASATTWRFDWIFNPLIVGFSSLAVAVLEKGRYTILSCLIAVFPFLLLYFASSSFRISSLLFVCFYVFIVFLISGVVFIIMKH